MQVTECLANLCILVGLLSVAPVSYLITILQREQVAQVRGCPIYVIADVALIPLSSLSEAQKAIIQAKESPKKSAQHRVSSPDSESSDNVEIDEAGQYLYGEQILLGSSGLSTKKDTSEALPSTSVKGTSSVAGDVIEKKGQYGRFAERWFSKKGWRMAQGMSVEGVEKIVTSSGQVMGLNNPQSKSPSRATTLDGVESSDRTSDLEVPNQASEAGNFTNTLLPKLLRTTRMLLGSRSFFFSYELDITRRLGTNDGKGSLIPLYKSADPLVSINSPASLSTVLSLTCMILF